MCTPGTHFSLCLKQDRVTPLVLFPWPHSVHLKIYRRRNMPSWESAVLYGTGVMTWPSGCVQLKMWQGCQTQLCICNLHAFFPETKKHILFFLWYVRQNLSLSLSLWSSIIVYYILQLCIIKTFRIYIYQKLLQAKSQQEPLFLSHMNLFLGKSLDSILNESIGWVNNSVIRYIEINYY